jgi:hypothetical protein
MCAWLHSPTGDKAADRLQAQESSAVKIRNSTVKYHTQISYLSRQNLQKLRRKDRKEIKNNKAFSYKLCNTLHFCLLKYFSSMRHVSLEMWVDTGRASLNKLLQVSKGTPNNEAANNVYPVTNDRKQMQYV